MGEEQKYTLPEAHQEFAKKTNGRVWELLDKPNRTTSKNEEMLLAAYASLYHWSKAGTVVNIQRGYWMVGKVYLSLGQKQSALDAALRCQELTDNNQAEMKDFDLAFAEELLARAYAFSGDQAEAKKHFQLAAELGENIQDPEDKNIFLGDLHGGEWYQLKL